MTVVKEWRPGHYRVVCERSGRVCWDDEVRKEWDGTIVHEKYFEARHPQDLVRSRRDQKPVPIPRPEPPDQFVENYYEFGFDNGFHFNFAPDVPDTANYTKTATSSSVQGPASDFWDFTSDAKWYRNANGLLVQGSANEMVREFDMSGNLWGWLIEPKAKQNLCLQSADLSTTWNNTACSETVNATTAPDGTLTADKVVEDSSVTTSHLMTQAINFTAGTVYTMSMWAKAAERSWLLIAFGAAAFSVQCGMHFNLGTGETGTVLNSATATVQRYADGWFRISVTATATITAAANIQLILSTGDLGTSYTGNGTSGLYIWGVQVEAGPVATSYIPTTTVAVTRAADRAYRLLGTEFDRTQGTYFARFRLGIGNKGGNQFVCYASDNSYNNSASFLSSGTGLPQMSINSGGGFAGLSTARNTALADRVDVRLAGAWQVNDVRTAIDAALGTLDPIAPLPLSLTRMDLGTDHAGASGNSCESLWLQELHYWPERKSNAFLQQRTSALL